MYNTNYTMQENDQLSPGTIYVKNMFLVDIGYGYQPMARRPYSINNINTENIKMMKNVCDNEIGINGKISVNAVATSLGDMIGLRGFSRDMNLIDMPNGWGQTRFRFILVIEVLLGAMTTQYFIQGYTDHVGASQALLASTVHGDKASHLDLNMSLFINSITEINIIRSAATGNPTFHMGDTYNTLQDYVAKHNRDMENRNLSLIRPSDLLKLNAVNLSNSYENGFPFEVPNSIVRGVGEYSIHSAASSLRRNTDPTVYFSRLLNGYLAGSRISSIQYDDNNEENVFMTAASQTPEPLLNNNLLITRLQEVTGNYCPTVLTLGNIFTLDPTLSSSERLFVMQGASQNVEVITYSPELNTMVTESTINPTPRNLQVLELNNSITANLTSCGLLQAHLYIDTFMKPAMVSIVSAKSLLGDEMTPACCEKFIAVIRNQIIPYITRGGTQMFQIHIVTDILKDTTISITEDGEYEGPRQVFRFPTFADSLYNPMIATKDDRSTLLNDLSVIYENTI